MEKRKTKEILNKYNIEYEIRKELITRINMMAFLSILIVGITVFVGFLQTTGSNNNNGIFFLAFVLICIYALYKLGLDIYRLSVFRTKYKVVKDTLTSVSWSIRNRRGTYLKLDFYDYGPYFIDKRKTLYTWSNIAKTDTYGLKDKCLPGDEFYLVKLGKEIICLYNSNDFKLDGVQINL